MPVKHLMQLKISMNLKTLVNVTTAIGKGGEKVEKGVNYITTECKGLWNKLFNSTPKPAAEPPAV